MRTSRDCCTGGLNTASDTSAIRAIGSSKLESQFRRHRHEVHEGQDGREVGQRKPLPMESM